MNAGTIALAICLGVLWSAPLAAQTRGPARNAHWQALYDSCLRATKAPKSSVTARKYCVCAANSVFTNFDFDARFRIAVKIMDKRLDNATRNRLKSLAMSCMRKAADV
jgi:hypothetical protein